MINTEYAMKRLAQGFTLIELLIVIAVLGILAVAVLSAINPVEQINRSRDTGSQSDAEQLIGAVDRFYATNGYYPWVTGQATTPFNQAWLRIINATVWTDGTTPVLAKLSTTGSEELKSSFTTRVSGASYNWLWIFNEGVSGSSTYVCFNPKSGAFRTTAAARCHAGNLPADFPNAGPAPLPCAAGCDTASPATCLSCLP